MGEKLECERYIYSKWEDIIPIYEPGHLSKANSILKTMKSISDNRIHVIPYFK